MCFLKVFGFRPFNPINKHYNPYLPCISQDTMYICFPYLCSIFSTIFSFLLSFLNCWVGPEGKNDTDVPKSLSYRPRVAVLPSQPTWADHFPLTTISPRSTAQVLCRLRVAGVSPESVLPLHPWQGLDLFLAWFFFRNNSLQISLNDEVWCFFF